MTRVPLVWANDPKYENLSNRGPIPLGSYLIGNGFHSGPDHVPEGGDDEWYSLYGENGSGGYTSKNIPPYNRGGFFLHTGLRSNGCITVLSDVAEGSQGYPRSAQFDQIKKILNSTKPINYKGSSYLGTVTVK